MDRRRVRRHPVLLATLVTSLQAGCRPVTTDDSGTSAPLTSASAAPTALCVGGQSEDPPMRDLDRALVAFEAKRYREAQALLDGLAQRFPRSATVRVWRGEATLYEGKLEDGADAYRDAATHALKFYREAAALHEAGCRLLASDHYYLRMGAAYAQLRLGAPNLALRELDIARATWPNSAEVPYTMARAECLRGRVDDCLAGFRATLEIARERRRPMFLRTHRSVADWVVRSRTQSEFGPLRADPRYQQLVREPWAAED